MAVWIYQGIAYTLSGKTHGNEHSQMKKKDKLTHPLDPIFQGNLKEPYLLSLKSVD